MTRYAILGMFLLVGCGDVSFSAASDNASVKPDLGTSLVSSADDAGADSAVAVTEVVGADAGTDDASDASDASEIDAGPDAGPVSYRVCCGTCYGNALVCNRTIGGEECLNDYNSCLDSCGTAPEGETCSPFP